MDELDEYTVDVNGVPHTFLLTAEDAKRRGAEPVQKSRKPANKGRTAPNK